MFKRLVARSVITGALIIGGASAVGVGRAHAQWNASPQAQPIECSSWMTTYGGGMCREEHFNQAATAGRSSFGFRGSAPGAPNMGTRGQPSGRRVRG